MVVCGVFTEESVNTTDANTGNTAEYGLAQLNTCPLALVGTQEYESQLLGSPASKAPYSPCEQFHGGASACGGGCRRPVVCISTLGLRGVVIAWWTSQRAAADQGFTLYPQLFTTKPRRVSQPNFTGYHYARVDICCYRSNLEFIGTGMDRETRGRTWDWDVGST